MLHTLYSADLCCVSGDGCLLCVGRPTGVQVRLLGFRGAGVQVRLLRFRAAGMQVRLLGFRAAGVQVRLAGEAIRV